MQTINYYRFWLLMVGAVCLASIHGGIAFLLAIGFIALGLVLPIFSKQIMAMGSKLENTVNKKVTEKSEKKTDDKPVEKEEEKTEEAA